MHQIIFFKGIQAQPVKTYSTSCPNTMENSTSSKQILKTPGKGFTRTKVKKMGVLRNIPESSFLKVFTPFTPSLLLESRWKVDYL